MGALAEQVGELFVQSRAEFEAVALFMGSEEAYVMRESDVERELWQRGREVLRKLLQEHLDARGLGAVRSEKVEDVDGSELARKRVHERTVGTVVGEVEVSRVGYGAPGTESLHPRDAELNLPVQRYSFELQRRAVEEVAKVSFDSAAASLDRLYGTGSEDDAAVIPKRQLEEVVKAAVVDFDAFYARHRAATDLVDKGSGSVLALGLDGKGVVMVHRDLRPATREAAEKAKPKMDSRLSSGEKRNRKRMAEVATVYTVQPWVRTAEEVANSLVSGSGLRAAEPVGQKTKRPRPENKRVWASLTKPMAAVIQEALNEAEARDPQHEKTWVALSDGNQEQLALVQERAATIGVTLVVILDLMHVLEYLWTAGRAFHPRSSKELEDWVGERLLQILRGRSSYVAAGMRRSATLRRLKGKKRKKVDRCARYLLNHRSYLHYDEYLAAGLPITTGAVEGTCRHLVVDRMEITGARWTLATAEAVLQARALRSSGDFDEYWTFHEEQEYQRNHAARYANKLPPATVPPPWVTRARLRRVK